MIKERRPRWLTGHNATPGGGWGEPQLQKCMVMVSELKAISTHCFYDFIVYSNYCFEKSFHYMGAVCCSEISVL